MIEDELVRIWQSSPDAERIKFEKSRLMLDVQAGIDRVDRMILYRDWVEAISVAIAVPVFIVFAFYFPHILAKVGSVFIVLWAIYVFIRLRQAKKHKPPGVLSHTYLDYLYQTRKHLKAQKNLLDTILYWYLIPCQIGATLFLLGIVLPLENMRLFIKTEIAGTLLGVIIYFQNKIALKKTLMPRLEKIENLIKVLEKE